MKKNGFTTEMKLELFTMGRNSIIMRVENIGDIFNTNGVVDYETVNIKSLAYDLFILMNGVDTIFQSEITELSLSGNCDYQ